MIDAAVLATGVTTGIVAEQGNKFIRSIAPEENNADPDMMDLLRLQTQYLRLIAEQSPRITPPENQTVYLNPYPGAWQVPDYDRPHLSIFVPSSYSGGPGAFSQKYLSIPVFIEIPGIGTHVQTLGAGWTQMDLPPGTLIYSADTNVYTVRFSFRDDPIGSANTESSSSSSSSSSVLGPALAPWSANPIQTASGGADTLYSFGPSGATLANHVIVQNGSKTVSFFLAFDSSSIGTGENDQIYQIPPGQLVRFDREFTVLHFSSPAQIAFGGQQAITVEAFI